MGQSGWGESATHYMAPLPPTLTAHYECPYSAGHLVSKWVSSPLKQSAPSLQTLSYNTQGETQSYSYENIMRAMSSCGQSSITRHLHTLTVITSDAEDIFNSQTMEHEILVEYLTIRTDLRNHTVNP